MAGGHFVAYVRRREWWYWISDSRSRLSSLEEALSRQAYVLLYVAREQDETQQQQQQQQQVQQQQQQVQQPLSELTEAELCALAEQMSLAENAAREEIARHAEAADAEAAIAAAAAAAAADAADDAADAADVATGDPADDVGARDIAPRGPTSERR